MLIGLACARAGDNTSGVANSEAVPASNVRRLRPAEFDDFLDMSVPSGVTAFTAPPANRHKRLELQQVAPYSLNYCRKRLIASGLPIHGMRRCLLRVVCHERSRSTRLRATVREMKEGPSGSAIRSLIPSHRELLRSKAVVVSVAETSGQ
jgi:hypothetical protein